MSLDSLHKDDEGRILHGIPHPPPNRRGVALPGQGAAPQGVTIHHWDQGPLDLIRTPARAIRLRSGTRLRVGYRFPWFLDRVEGARRAEAARALYDVLLHDQTWSRAGVHWVRVKTAAEAKLLVRIIPSDNTYCGAGAAGCYSWGYDPSGMPVVEIGVEYLGTPEFANLVNHELCGHATFRMHDMYPRSGVQGHDGYVGTMGTWDAARKSGYYPPSHEVAWSKEWLAAGADHVHDH